MNCSGTNSREEGLRVWCSSGRNGVMSADVITAVEPREGSSEAVAAKKGNNKYGRKGRPLSRKRVSDLEAMRYVVSTSWSEEKTYQHKEMRKWLESDRKGFMVQLQKLEAEERSAAREQRGLISDAAAATAAPAVPDLTVGEIRELIDKMLEGSDDAGDNSVIAGDVAQEGSAGVACQSEDAASDTVGRRS